MSVYAHGLCTVLNSKFTHRPYMNDRVRASRVHARLTKARVHVQVLKGVLLCVGV